MKKTILIALIALLVGQFINAQVSTDVVEGTISGEHVVKAGYNNWGHFCNSVIVVQKKSESVVKYHLYGNTSGFITY